MNTVVTMDRGVPYRTGCGLPKNTPDLLADVHIGLRVVDEVVHLAVVLALVALDPQPAAGRRRLLRLQSR